ncbi:MAG: FkbM family methyltransferase, partial [Bryobacteraceae bacterium]
LKILAPIAALAAVVFLYPPARLAAIVVLGRSPVCPMANAIRSADNVRSQIAHKDRILQASKLLAEEPGFEHWETPRGRYWIPAGSRYVLPFNLAEQERKIYGEGERFVRPGDVVLDCGANVGVFTRVALDAGARLVVAIEPAPENIECLRRNYGADRRVVIYPKGVWDKDDMLALHVDPHNSAADSLLIRRAGGHEGEKVPLTTIDKLVVDLKLDRVDFIKMDIEGAEQRALQGAQATLARFHPRMALSAYHDPTDPQRIPALARQAWSGYRMACGPCAEANGRVRPDILYFW